MDGIFEERVFGTGYISGSSRFISSIVEYVGLNTEVIKGSIVSEHGDSQIFIWSRFSIAGMPMEEYCSAVSLS